VGLSSKITHGAAGLPNVGGKTAMGVIKLLDYYARIPCSSVVVDYMRDGVIVALCRSNRNQPHLVKFYEFEDEICN
jgi:hypothetical protein